MIIAATRDPAGFVLKHWRRDVQYLGHLQTGRMTKFAQPEISIARSYLFFFQVGANPSFISGHAPVIYIFDLHRLVRP